MLEPKRADNDFLDSWFCPTLRSSAPYHLDQAPQALAKLDQNESPFDWPIAIKKLIAERLVATPWNRYPDPFSQSLTAKLGAAIGVNPTSIVTGPGSNYLIPLLMDAMVPQLRGKLVIARPSFALFEEHARYSGYAYEPWLLDDDLEYDMAALPDLPPGSLLIFASPNNPTGSRLPLSSLKTLLAANPQSLVVADEAYFEFAGDSAQELLRDYSNLLIVRTLSKTLAAAGVRLGYLIGPANMIALLAKKRLPYLLNHFTVTAAEVLLTSEEMKAFMGKHVAHVLAERARVFEALTTIGASRGVVIKDSATNFLLLRCPDQNTCDQVYQGLLQMGVIVRNISKGPKLAGCLRVTIGSVTENDLLLQAAAKVLAASQG